METAEKGTTMKMVGLDNKAVGEVTLPGTVFGVEPNRPLVYEAVRAYMLAGRRGTHDTKVRSEVQGSGKKLWRQKKTGRARIGSVRSPLWRHGGTVHGPTPRSYAFHFPKRKRALALRVALSQKIREGRVILVDTLDLETHKTKALLERMDRLGVKGSALVLDEPVPRNLDLAARNLTRHKVCLASGVNIVDLLRHDWLVVSKSATKRLEEVLGP
jgi:large subunit ribosomal protein L4